jgi:hypothetical protein
MAELEAPSLPGNGIHPEHPLAPVPENSAAVPNLSSPNASDSFSQPMAQATNLPVQPVDPAMSQAVDNVLYSDVSK